VALTKVWDTRVHGRARTFDSSQVHTPAVEWGSVVGPVGPLGDGGNGSGFEVATSYATAVGLGLDRNMLAAAIDLDEDPQDQTPLVDPIPPGYEGGLWGLRVSTVVISGDYEFPPELADAGYTLTVGFATLDSFGGTTLSGIDYPLTTGADVRTDALIDHGITDTSPVGTVVSDLTFFTVTTDLVDAVNAGVKVPYLAIEGPFSGRDPLLLVADLVLSIYVDDAAVFVQSVCRQFPRDDSLGLGAAPRIHPPSKGRRIAGGY
jgi:hypothetical protein